MTLTACSFVAVDGLVAAKFLLSCSRKRIRSCDISAKDSTLFQCLPKDSQTIFVLSCDKTLEGCEALPFLRPHLDLPSQLVVVINLDDRCCNAHHLCFHKGFPMVEHGRNNAVNPVFTDYTSIVPLLIRERREQWCLPVGIRAIITFCISY